MYSVEEILAWIRDDPRGVAESLIAAQEEVDRLHSQTALWKDTR